MRESKLHYRKPHDDSYPPRHRTNQPMPRSPLSDQIEERIVMLYTSGQSVEAIIREVGRARHLVVHILQARGVFGIKQKEAIREKPKSESLTVEELTEVPAIQELEPKSLAVEGSGPEIAVEETDEKPKLPGEPESPRKLEPIAVEEPGPTAPAAEEPRYAERWLPPVVDALCKVIMQFNLYQGMRYEEVRKMVSGWNRQTES